MDCVIASLIVSILVAGFFYYTFQRTIEERIERMRVDMQAMELVRAASDAPFQRESADLETRLRDALKGFQQEELKEYAEENVRRDLLAATRFVDFVFGRYRGKNRA